jgi:hypothetical protein
VATEFWLPEQLAREQHVEDQIAGATFWNRIVRSVDPALSVVFVRGTASAKSVGLEPGRWHVRRKNRGLPDSYMPITTPDGGYREPDQGMLDDLSRRDMWRTPGVGSDQLAETARRRRREEKDAELRREQQRDMAAEDFRAARRTIGDDPEASRFARGKPNKRS